LGVGEKIRGDPGGGVVRALVAFPSNQVTKLALQAVIDSGVQDLRDLVFLFVIDFHWRRGFNFAVRNGAGFVGF